MTASTAPTLHKTLGTFQLWGIAVGLVISGEYFGWSYGWNTAGTLGFLVATVLVATMYTTFIFSFTELTTAIPHAGGPFAYSRRAFGEKGGLIAGLATLIEFVFAPPAIALAIGAYLNVQFPALDPQHAAVGAYFVFMGLNILGVKLAATFELVVCVLAVAELLVFMGVVAPAFSFSNFALNGWAGADTFGAPAIAGIFAAIPFAIWFFLAIEGAAMAAEEAKDPKRTIPKAYISGILTLVFLAMGVMFFAGGVGDWRTLSNINDPLPQAMKTVVGESSGWLHMLVWIGLFGLVASFHGIILGYSRQFFALARAGYLPPFLANLDDLGISVLKMYGDKAQSGAMSKEEAQKQAMAVIKSMRYGKDGYLSITSNAGVTIMHPIKPENDGKNMLDFKDPKGTYLYRDIVATANSPAGTGFVKYWWPRPGAKEASPKLSHVISYKPWEWNLITGVYMDDIDDAFQASLLKSGGVLLLVCALLAGIVSYINRSLRHTIGGEPEYAAEVAARIAGGDLSGASQAGELVQTVAVFKLSAADQGSAVRAAPVPSPAAAARPVVPVAPV
eukprot:gene37803-46642_t